MIDPHAENYYSTSTYAYAANNPIVFTDPDGRDIWHINEEGEIIYHDPDYTDADKFHIVDSDGNIIDGQSIEFEYGTVESVEEVNIRGRWPDQTRTDETLTLFDIKGDENATELFEFFADPDNTTTVEWTHAKLGEDGSEKNIVGTMHHERGTGVGNYISRNNPGNLRELNHSHPSGGYPSQPDIDNAARYQSRHPNIWLQVYISGHGYIPYNKNSRHIHGVRAGSLRPLPSVGPPTLIP